MRGRFLREAAASLTPVGSAMRRGSTRALRPRTRHAAWRSFGRALNASWRGGARRRRLDVRSPEERYAAHRTSNPRLAGSGGGSPGPGGRSVGACPGSAVGEGLGPFLQVRSCEEIQRRGGGGRHNLGHLGGVGAINCTGAVVGMGGTRSGDVADQRKFQIIEQGIHLQADRVNAL